MSEYDRSIVLNYLFDFWSKRFGAKIITKKVNIRGCNLDAIIILPRRKTHIREEEHHDLIKEIRKYNLENTTLPKDLEVIGVRVLLWNRVVGYQEYIKARRILEKEGRLDRILIIVSVASWQLQEYCKKDSRVMLLEYGEIVSFLKALGREEYYAKAEISSH